MANLLRLVACLFLCGSLNSFGAYLHGINNNGKINQSNLLDDSSDGQPLGLRHCIRHNNWYFS